MTTTLELEICGPGPDGYEVRVVKAAAGGGARGSLRLDVDELLARRETLQDKVVLSAQGVRRAMAPSEHAVQQVGQQLFEALFDGPVSGSYRASLSVAQERQDRLQIVLRLEPPELTLLPWEALFDPQLDAYVCRHEPMVRHLPAAHTPDPLPVEPPLRILVVIASPRGLPLLDSEGEREQLEQALAEQVDSELVELAWLTDASWDTLHSRLMDGPWHIVHFIGHGDYGEHAKEGQIALVGQTGAPNMVEASRLADLLGEAEPTPRLMVLNSCASAQGRVDDGFSSMGAALVRSGISAVAAMQFAVTDLASVSFARGFYTALAHGRRVDNAVKSGRISMLGMSQSLEWITPVLYMHGDANLLFNLAAPAREPHTRQQQSAAGSATEESHYGEKARKLYVRARAELRVGNPETAVELLDDLLALNPNHSDAIMLRSRAADQAQLSELYTLAVEAEDTGQWSEAINYYEQILQKEPDYRDVSSRRDLCRGQEYIGDLQDELRQHAEAQRWQTVLEVSEELKQIDPTTDDPDGLATYARQKIAQDALAAQLEDVYTGARTAEMAGKWAAAIEGYEQILQNDLQYRDVRSRRDRCRELEQIEALQDELRQLAERQEWQTVLDVSEKLNEIDPTTTDPDGLTTRARQQLAQAAARAAQLEDLYDSAYTAEQSENWAAAIDGYEKVLRNSPHYRDALTRRDHCLDRQRIAVLQDELRRVAHTQQWQAVIEISEELRLLDPTTADPDGLTSRARQELAQAAHITQLDLYTRARAAEKSEDWATAIACYDDLARMSGGEYRDSTQRRTMCLERLHSEERVSDTPDEAPAYITMTREIDAPCGCLAWASMRWSLAVNLSDDPRIRIYDMAGDERLSVKTSNKGPPYVLAFSPDGTRLASQGRKGVTIWDADTGESILQLSLRQRVTAAVFNRDGSRIATGTYDSARVWDAETAEEIFRTEQHAVKAMTFSPDGGRLVIADRLGLHAWNLGTEQRDFEDRRSSLESIAYSPDGKRFAAGSRDGTALLWTSGEVEELVHEGPVTSVAFNPNGTTLATGSKDGAARIWDTSDGELMCRINYDEPVNSVAFSPYGTWLAIGTQTAVTLWTFE
ncbi:CHAT domain-containing protein [Streptomyces sp. NPDC053367]|uniref:CHAT domain-containing protein n=1 Tax=Streptomyces sp. NPDC053367 TaxID=3365700 RepID=UPI0037CEB604